MRTQHNLRVEGKLKNLMANIDQLSTKEKALAAHCLLSAMDRSSEDNVDSEWLSLAEQRSVANRHS